MARWGSDYPQAVQRLTSSGSSPEPGLHILRAP
jgi:hypothetical protein